MNTVIETASGERRVLALRLLFARFPVAEQESRLRDALTAAERGTLNLRHLLLAETDGLVVGAALVMLQSDGIALVWPPVISCGATDDTVVADLLMREVCRRIDAVAARLGQCLLSPDDVADAAVLARHGFERATDMFFLARAITGDNRTRADDGARGDDRARADHHLRNDARSADGAMNVSRAMNTDDVMTVESYRPENADRFARLVEATYRGSLDCQYLNGVRTGAEAIISHQLSGQFDPERWSLYSLNGQDAGVLLLNDHPDQDAVELVYVGVAPEARGRGLGRRMIQAGLRDAAEHGRAVMFLAVDCENHYANSLYGEFEFAELARRQIMLRRAAGLARQ